METNTEPTPKSGKKTPAWFVWYIKNQSKWKLLFPFTFGLLIPLSLNWASTLISSPSDIGLYGGLAIVGLNLFLITKTILAVFTASQNNELN